MTHTLNLCPGPYHMIERGEKTIELRLYDEKRQKIQTGDILCLVHTEDETKKLYARVVALHLFNSFAELYRHLPLLKCGYTPQNVGNAHPRDMDAYYSPRLQGQYRALGIEIQLLKGENDI